MTSCARTFHRAGSCARPSNSHASCAAPRIDRRDPAAPDTRRRSRSGRPRSPAPARMLLGTGTAARRAPRTPRGPRRRSGRRAGAPAPAAAIGSAGAACARRRPDTRPRAGARKTSGSSKRRRPAVGVVVLDLVVVPSDERRDLRVEPLKVGIEPVLRIAVAVGGQRRRLDVVAVAADRGADPLDVLVDVVAEEDHEIRATRRRGAGRPRSIRARSWRRRRTPKRS